MYIPFSLPRSIILDIIHCIPASNALLASLVLALRIQQLLTERAEIGDFGRLFDDNLLPVVADLVDDPFGVFAELELVESRYTVRMDGDTVEVLEVGRRDVEAQGWEESRVMSIESVC